MAGWAGPSLGPLNPPCTSQVLRIWDCHPDGCHPAHTQTVRTEDMCMDTRRDPKGPRLRAPPHHSPPTHGTTQHVSTAHHGAAPPTLPFPGPSVEIGVKETGTPFLLPKCLPLPSAPRREASALTASSVGGSNNGATGAQASGSGCGKATSRSRSRATTLGSHLEPQPEGHPQVGRAGGPGPGPGPEAATVLSTTPGLLPAVWELPGGRRACAWPRGESGTPQAPAGRCPPHRPCLAQQRGPWPLWLFLPPSLQTLEGPSGRPAVLCLRLLHTHPTPRPSPAPSSSQRSDGQVCPPALRAPPPRASASRATWRAGHLPCTAWAAGASAGQTPGRGRTGKQNPASTPNPLPCAAQAQGDPLLPSGLRTGRALSAWEPGGAGGCLPATSDCPPALGSCPCPCRAGGCTYLGADARPPRAGLCGWWLAAGRLGGGRSGAGRSGGRAAWGREAGRGGTAL